MLIDSPLKDRGRNINMIKLRLATYNPEDIERYKHINKQINITQEIISISML